MSDAVFLKGIILSVSPCGESDKRLVILTGERGKITVFAKGARRARSNLSASTEMFVYGTFECYEGRNAYTLLRVKVHDYFRNITNSFEGVSLGYYLLELCSYYAVEGSPEKEMLNLLYISIAAIIKNDTPREKAEDIYATDLSMVRLIFELRLMVIFGEYPGLDEDTEYYDLKELKSVSGHSSANEIRLSAAAVYTIRYIQYIELTRLYNFKIGKEVYYEVKTFLERYIFLHRHHCFRSWEMIETGKFLL